jgi:putative ABC transport system ATP-binding protein
MVTHDAEVAAFAARTLRFRDGRLVSDTRHAPRDAAEALAAMRPGAQGIAACPSTARA